MTVKTGRVESSSGQDEWEERPSTPVSRFLVVAAVMVGMGLGMVFQLVRWQVIQHPQLVALAQSQSHGMDAAPVRARGGIYDSQDHLLAVDIYEHALWAKPEEIPDVDAACIELAPELDMTPAELVRKIMEGGAYPLIATGISEETREKIESFGLRGFHWEPRPKRLYPEGPLAAHVLGFVNAAHEGYYGVEGFYDAKLESEPSTLSEKARDDPILALCSPPEPKPGQELHLTVDRAIQYMVEKELIAALRTYQAPSGSIIVMDPKTGAILAMANWPTYDPNHFMNTPPENIANPAISRQYEPGSVFKIVTMAAGLDASVVTPRSRFKDTGELEVGGRKIYNWDRAAHGEVDMTEVLAMSLNVGAAHISTTMGKDRFYTYLRRFGFGRETDVDMAGDVRGALKLPGGTDWHESDLGTNSFGQGIACTPLQMVRSIAAVANKGLLMKPYIVGRIVEGDKVIDIKPTVVRRAISAGTAEALTHMLVDALERETQLALIPGYAVAGKTGTAEIPTPGGYKTDETIASFIGYAPANDPKFIVLVKIDRPKSSPWGSKVAAPVFRRVAEQLLSYMDIPPDNVLLAAN